MRHLAHLVIPLKPNACPCVLLGGPSGVSSLLLTRPLTWLPADMPVSREERPRSGERAPAARLDEARDPGRDKANAAMERYAQGEDQAFSQLYDSLAPRLHQYLLRSSRDPARAADLLQETMLRIHRARGRFIVGAEVLPWAFAIARRLHIDSARRRKGEHRTISLETGGHEASPLEAAADQSSADELLDAQRLAGALEDQLERLPESHREAFELIQNDGLSIREAADVLGITPNAVKLRAHRAYVALRIALGNVVDRS
jgi:RNA polymerase sigma-70 factor (ECF subfamily)